MRIREERQLFGVRAKIWAFALAGFLIATGLLRLALDPSAKTPSPDSTPPIANHAAPPEVFLRPEKPVPPPTARALNEGTPWTHETLRSVLHSMSDPDAQIRLATVQSLRTLSLRPDLILPALIACLSDSDARIRAAAASELSRYRMSAADAVPTLKTVAAEDPEEKVRVRAREALYNIRIYDFPFGSPLIKD